jgi:DNA-binding MarR family transcriptional regulator
MNSALKGFITGLAEIKSSGQSLSFSVFHLFYALELMSEKTVGRNKLAEQLNVGEGAVRTIVSRLVGASLMTTSKAGCTLTVEGLHVWREFEEVFPRRVEFLRTELTPSEFNYAFLVKGSGSKVGSGIEQRDAAIVAGAVRALVIVFRSGRLLIESVSDDIGEAFPKAASQILRDLEPQDDDVIVIAGGDTALKAMHGAFAASWSLA